MGRRPCCEKEGQNRGTWSVGEDNILTNYINIHGVGHWRDLPLRAGLKRCGKSCRLRWLNYLRPGIKRGNVSAEEEELIVKMHNLLGNRWSLIAGRLPGRTDNEIKNYWNTNLRKRAQAHKIQNNSTKNQNHFREKGKDSSIALKPWAGTYQPHEIIKTKAVRCTKVVIIPQQPDDHTVQKNQGPTTSDHRDSPWSSLLVDDDHHHEDSSPNLFLEDFDISELLTSDVLSSELDEKSSENKDALQNNSTDDDISQMVSNTWNASNPLHPVEALELKKLASFLDSEEEWISKMIDQ